MEEYKDMINNFFSKKSSDLIYNSSKDHAKFLIKKLFESAKKNIRLYTSGEEIVFYKENKVNIKDNKDIHLEIIVDRDCKKNEYHELFPSAKIFCIKEKRKFNIELSNQMEDSEYSAIKHFIAIDEDAFRVEKPHAPGSDNVEAVGCAYNNILTKGLNNAFETIKNELSEPASF